MSKKLVRNARIAVTLTMIGLIIAGCGRKGELDRPGTPPEQQNIRRSGEKQQEPVEDRPFALDPLL